MVFFIKMENIGEVGFRRKIFFIWENVRLLLVLRGRVVFGFYVFIIISKGL